MEYKCDYCSKQFNSRQSRWMHIKRNHVVTDVTDVTVVNTKIHECKICNENFNNRQSRWRHEKKCDKIEENNRMKQLEKQLEEMNKEIKKLKKNKSVKKINVNNINNGEINNITINNTIELGAENIKLLTENQKLNVLKSINNGELPIITLIDELSRHVRKN